MKKIIITGCNGFIGSHFVDFYKKKKYMVYGIDRNVTKVNDNNVKYYQFDLEDENISNFYKEVNPDFFIHCAGNANVGISVDYPEMDFNKNVGVLYKTLSSIKRAEINPRFIFLSSAAVYGNPSRLPIDELMETNPISPYGLHKKMCEDLCKYYRDIMGKNISVVRIFSAYGDGLRKQILWDMYNKYLKNNRIELFGTGNETRDFIHIDDVVQALDIIAEKDNADFIYNVANGEEISIKFLATEFVKCLGMGAEKVKFNGKVKVGDPLNWKADITKLKKLGYHQNMDLVVGIKKYIDWVKKINGTNK